MRALLIVSLKNSNMNDECYQTSWTYFVFLLPVPSPPGVRLRHLGVSEGSLVTALSVICSRDTVLQGTGGGKHLVYEAKEKSS